MVKKVLLNTTIPANADLKVLKAFLHGHTSGSYEIYNRMDKEQLSIQFECGEDATNFELKQLDKIFIDSFYRLHASPSPQDKPLAMSGLWYDRPMIGKTST